METTQVFRVRVAGGEGSPRIDTLLPDNSSKKIPWGKIGKILLGKAPASEYEPIQVAVDEKGWQNWHYYPMAGTYGLFSQTLIDLIGRYMKSCFEPYLPAFVNGLKYYFLRQIGTLDCLDRKHSELIPFPHDPQRVMEIEHYRFIKAKIPDPIVFVIPEVTGILASQSIKKMVEGAKLYGLVFLDAEKIGE